MPTLAEHRIDAWTELAAEPAVRAAEHSLTTPSSSLLADTLAVSTATEARRRLARVLGLKARAEADPSRREAYHRAAEDLRNWAASVYLAALGEPCVHTVRHPFEDGVGDRWRAASTHGSMEDEANDQREEEST